MKEILEMIKKMEAVSLGGKMVILIRVNFAMI